MSETGKTPPPLSLALAILRTRASWTQKRLAEAAGTYGRVISEYEAGTTRRRLQRDTFDRLVSLMGYEAEEVALTFLYLAGLGLGLPDERLTPIDPTPGEERRISRIAAHVGLIEGNRMRERLRQLARWRRAEAARHEAGELWEALRCQSPARQREMVEQRREFQSWAVVERLCEESTRAAGNAPARALALARLALRAAELVPGDPRWQSCLLGYAHAFVGNGLRVSEQDLAAAEAAFATAWRLWRAGRPSAQGPLGEWRLLELEASLRRDLRHFDAALDLLRRALEMAPPTARGRILLMRGFLLEQAGQIGPALGALDEAAPLLDAAGEPRERMGVRFNRLTLLCHLGRFAEAEAALPHLRSLIADGTPDALRYLWLSGRVAAGLRRRPRARRAFSRVARQFAGQRQAYDCALVSLDLAALLLEDGQPAKVAVLAEEMAWIFASRRVHREALAALRLFMEAARAGRATAELARRVLAYLELARQDPRLRFDEIGSSLDAT
jgi:tetratricopeptide (TPR) repeat protein